MCYMSDQVNVQVVPLHNSHGEMKRGLIGDFYIYIYSLCFYTPGITTHYVVILFSNAVHNRHQKTASYIVFRQVLSWTTPHFTKIIDVSRQCFNLSHAQTAINDYQAYLRCDSGILVTYSGGHRAGKSWWIMTCNAPIQEKYPYLMWGTLMIFSITRVVLESQVFFHQINSFLMSTLQRAAYNSNYTDNHITL